MSRKLANRKFEWIQTLLLISGAALIGSGCSPGSGAGLDISGRPLAEGGDVPLAPTLAAIQANVFDPYCIVCHSGANAPLGLRLDAASSYTGLVSMRSRQDGSLFRVEPGEPDRSYLVRKLEGTASTGGQMPLDSPPLPQSTINFVRQWIVDGALSEEPDEGLLVVATLSPAPDDMLGSLPDEITAGFDRDIDASTVNDQTFLLTRSGGDDIFGNGNDVSVVPVSAALSPVNPRLAVMDLKGVTPVEDRYRVTLRGSGANVILDIGGAALDGEFAGVFPSGDGAEGGDFLAEFEVRGLQPTLDSIQANVFALSCAFAGCHSGPTGPNLPAGMDLTSADASFANLVNIASLQVAGLNRVSPTDASASYLVQKLEGTAAAGNRMPWGGPYLDQETIDIIRLWIDNGALR